LQYYNRVNNVAKSYGSTYLSPIVTLHLCISLLKQFKSSCSTNHSSWFSCLQYQQFEYLCVFQRRSTAHSSFQLFHKAQFLFYSRLHQQFESSISTCLPKTKLGHHTLPNPTCRTIRQSHPRCDYCIIHTLVANPENENR
jgi:hypothetical protein